MTLQVSERDNAAGGLGQLLEGDGMSIMGGAVCRLFESRRHNLFGFVKTELFGFLDLCVPL